jgi:hypothetical protein
VTTREDPHDLLGQTQPIPVMPDLGPRLADDPAGTLRHCLEDEVDTRGVALEFGVASGRTLAMIAGHMPVVGFDSFEGLPEDWRPGFPAGTFAGPAPQVPGAQLVIGWFADTLPDWVAANQHILPRIRLVHIDCDLHSSTATILRHLPLPAGCVVVFDEYHGYDGWIEGEHRAWTTHVQRNQVAFTPIGHGPEQLAVRIL